MLYIFHVAIINSQFGNYFLKEMNLKEYFAHKHYVPKVLTTDVKISTFWWKMGMRLWIMKWTFKAIQDVMGEENFTFHFFSSYIYVMTLVVTVF